MTDVRTIDFDVKKINDYLHGGNSPKRYFDDIVLMQSTGLFDKNGVEIFEGDILKWDRKHVLFSNTDTEVVSMDFPELPIIKSLKWVFVDTYYSEVLGNVHENPELVGGGKNDSD